MVENSYEKTESIKDLLKKNDSNKIINSLKETIKKKKPNHQEKLLLAKIYLEIKDYKNSYLILHELSNSEFVDFDTYYTLGNFFLEKKNFFLAAKYFIKSIRLNNNFSPSWLNLAYICKETGHLIFSEKFYKKTIQIQPDYIRAKFNLSHVQLALKKFDEGFSYYENRWLWKDFKSKFFFKNLIVPNNLNDLKNEKIVIFDEQGFGDTFLFIRYLNLFLPSTKVYFATKKSLHKILSFNQNKYEVIDITKPLTDASIKFTLPLMSLPLFFKKYEDCKDFSYPYIYSDELKNKFWLNKIKTLSDKSKFKIGVCFSRKQALNNRDDRSINVKYLKKILSNSSCDFFNLSVEKLLSESSFVNNKIITFESIDLEDKFIDTASIINQMDIVLSIDTSIAHLSGSLNKKTILLLNFISEWRWGTSSKTKWYQNHVILRRNKFENWDKYFLRVEKRFNEELDLINRN